MTILSRNCIWIIWGCWILCLAGGCAGLEIRPIATPTSAPSGTILFQDDFSKIPGDWGLWDRKGGLITYEQGGFRILVNEIDYDFWSVAGKHFGDTLVEVDAARLAGTVNNAFGLICRYQDNRNFYMFLVSSDGYFGIAKLSDGEYRLIGSKQLQYSGLINSAQAAHRLKAGCVGDHLTLWVDSNKMLEVQDPDFTSGDVGLMAGTYSSGGVDILFDNFQVRQP